MTIRERLLAQPVVYKTLKSTLLPPRSLRRIVDEFFAAGEGEAVLDLGCGYGDYARYFAGRCRYVGIDHNAAYLDTARSLNAGLDVAFICADVNDPVVAEHGPYDLVLLGGVLHHLDDDQVLTLANDVADLLTPGGRLVALEPVFDPDQRLLARLIIAADRGRHVRDVAGYASLLATRLPAIETDVHHDLLRIPYTHLVIEARVGTRREPSGQARAPLAVAAGVDGDGLD